MVKRFSHFGLVLALVLSLVACGSEFSGKNQPWAENGVLDLTTWDFQADGPVELSGQWEFFWERLLDRRDFTGPSPARPDAFLDLPYVWDGLDLENKKPGPSGYATLRLKVKLPGDAPKLGFKFLVVNTAYDFFADGRKVASVGQVGTGPETSVPDWQPQVICLDRAENPLELILHVSNFVHRNGGPFETILLGSQSQVHHARTKKVALDLFLAGAIFIMGLYHLSLYLARRGFHQALYFGVFCVLVAAYTLLTGERFFNQIFPWAGWHLRYALANLSIISAAPFYVAYFHVMFPRQANLKVVKIIIWAFGLVFASVILLPARLFTYTIYGVHFLVVVSCVYMLFAGVRAWKQKEDGAGVFLAGFVFLFACAINDILYENLLVRTGSTVELGLFLFIFSQSFLMARRFARAFDSVSSHKNALEQANVALQREVTQRKAAQQALHQETERFRVLVEQSPFGVLIIGSEEEIKYINPRFEEMFGYCQEDMPNMLDWAMLAYPEEKYREQVVATYFKDLKKPGAHNAPPRIFTVVCKDRTEKIVRFRMVGMESGDRFIIHEDITEQKKLEDSLRQAQKMEAVGTMAGGIAHDFNNLLMGIQGNTSLILLSVGEDYPHYKMLRNIEKQVQSGARLTRQLLGYARKGTFEMKALDLNHLVAETCETFGRTHKAVVVHLALLPGLYPVDGDQAQLEQVLFNIYLNSADAMPGGGELFIKTRNLAREALDLKEGPDGPENYVLLTISDTGQGMDPLTRDRIFDPFFTTKKTGSGTGLGLASAQGIIAGHGGIIDVETEPGKGTVFRIYLPASGKKTVEKDVTRPRSVVGGTETILIVDDDPVNLEAGAGILEMLGYQVIRAPGGLEAMDIFDAQHENIDLVLLDMIMPQADGATVFAHIKKRDPDIRVLLCSGFSEEGPARQVLENGGNGFIQKPFDLETLSTAIRDILEARGN